MPTYATACIFFDGNYINGGGNKTHLGAPVNL